MAGDVANWPDHAVSKPVIHPSVTLTHDAGRYQLGNRKSFLGEVLGEGVKRVGGKPHPELFSGELVETFFGEERSGVLRRWFVQPLPEEPLGLFVDLEKARALLAIARCFAVFIVQLVAQALS